MIALVLASPRGPCLRLGAVIAVRFPASALPRLRARPCKRSSCARGSQFGACLPVGVSRLRFRLASSRGPVLVGRSFCVLVRACRRSSCRSARLSPARCAPLWRDYHRAGSGASLVGSCSSALLRRPPSARRPAVVWLAPWLRRPCRLSLRLGCALLARARFARRTVRGARSLRSLPRRTSAASAFWRSRAAPLPRRCFGPSGAVSGPAGALPGPSGVRLRGLLRGYRPENLKKAPNLHEKIKKVYLYRVSDNISNDRPRRARSALSTRRISSACSPRSLFYLLLWLLFGTSSKKSGPGSSRSSFFGFATKNKRG